MQHRLPTADFAVAAIVALAAAPAASLEGDVGMHDPSTVIQSEGHYYSFGTGGGLPVSVSNDGWVWRREGVLMEGLPGGRAGEAVLVRGGNNTWAPDVIAIGGKFFIYYSAPGQQPKAAIGLLVGTTLDPASPDYGWQDGGPVVWSDGIEDSNAIDPGVFLDPNDGRFWLSYGSYFGYIRLVELDPATGQRLHADEAPLDIAINSEASIIIERAGWYYLLVTHGSCCRGAESTYNIRMGRSRSVTGPYLDHTGVDMLRGGGTLFLGSTGRVIGPGHFGRLVVDESVEKFSLHFEADLDRGGISVLDIRPLLWRDGWPVAGENLSPGTYAIESLRTGTALELAVEGTPVGGPRGRGGARGAGPGPGGGAGAGGGPAGRGATTAPPIPPQTAAALESNWPAGPVAARLSPFMLQAQQQWTVAPIEGDGYPGAPYFRIAIAGTERVLAATAGRELEVVPAFTGAAEQLWRIEPLTDGSWRLMPKAIPGADGSFALSAVGASKPTLEPFDAASDRQRWRIRLP